MNLTRWSVSPKTYSVLYAAAAIAAVLADIAWASWRKSNQFGHDSVQFAALALLFASFALGLLWWLRHRERAQDAAGYRTDISLRQELVMIGIAGVVGVAMRRLSM